MKGTVEIYSVTGDKWEKLYEDSNLVVHNGRTALADIFTFVPPPSGVMTSDFEPYYAVSNFTVQSMTLGAGTNTMKYRDSRHGLTLNNRWGTEYLDVSGRTYSLLPYRENFLANTVGAFGVKKDSAVDYTINQYVDLPISKATIHRHGKVLITEDKDLDGGSYTIEKRLGQDVAIIEIPVELINATDYKLSLGIEGKLPVQLEIGREDRMTPRNVLSVDLREQLWDFSQSQFVFQDEQKSDTNLSKTLYASSVIIGELTETFFSTAFDKIDQNKRVEQYTYFVRLICPKASDFEKGEVRIFSPRLEVLNNLIVKNPNFTRVESFIENTSFKDLTPYDITDIPTANMEQLKSGGVYQIGGWDHPSPLYASSNFTDLATSSTCEYGWIALENVDEYGTSGAPPQTLDGNESNIGVAFHGRSFHFDNSATPQLSKTFKFPGQWIDFYSQTGTRFEPSSLLNDPYTARSLVIKMDVDTVSSTANGSVGGLSRGVGLRLKNLSNGLSYNFVSGVSQDKGDWSESGASGLLAANQQMATNVTVQANVTLPLAFVNDIFKLDIIGGAGTNDSGAGTYDDDKGKLVIRNLDIGQYEGWHLHEGSHASAVMAVSSVAGSPTSALDFRGCNDVFNVNFHLVSSLGQLTYISQTLSGLDPDKAYNFILEGENISGGSPTFAAALIHKGYGNPNYFDYARYLTIGLPQNAGNAYNKYFNPSTSVSGFTMFGPDGPPSNIYRDLDFKDHQRCVKWTTASSLGAESSSLEYKYISSGIGQEQENHYHVSIPDGNYNFSLDLRHVFDKSVIPSYGLYRPVGVKVRVSIPGVTGEAYYYDFYARKFIRASDNEVLLEDLLTTRWTTRILQGSYGPDEFAHSNYTNRAKSQAEIYEAAGDPEGWTNARFYFDVKSSDFGSDVKRTPNEIENHVNHTIWGTRNVEIIFTSQPEYFSVVNDLDGILAQPDPSGTVYIKNFSLMGPPPPREPANTYFVYAGGGVWNQTSSLNSAADYNPVLETGPITGVRPSKMVTSGIETWNPLLHGDENRQDFTFFSETTAGKQKVEVIYGMSALGSSFGTSTLDNTGEAFPNNHSWAASKDSTYELMIFPTAGTPLKLHGAYLVDAALPHYNGPTVEKYSERNKVTSQPDASGVALRHAGGWSVQYVKQQMGLDRYTTHFPKVYSYVSGTPNGDEYYVGITKGSSESWVSHHSANLCYFDTVKNWGIKPGRNHAFSFDYAATGNTVDVGIFMEYGDTLFWLSGTDNTSRLNTRWVPADVKKHTIHMYDSAFASVAEHNIQHGPYTSLSRNFLSHEFHIPTRIPDDARMGVMIRNRASSSHYRGIFRDLRAYVCADPDEVVVKIPEFPEEQDSYVQEPTDASTPGEYGHFQNAIEFIQSGTTIGANSYHASAITHIPTIEKAHHRGAYLPASGLTVSAGALGYTPGLATYGGWNAETSALSGTLNLFSTVTPRGHILNNFSAVNINDSSAGLVVSGPIAAVSAAGNCVVKYAISLSANEVHYLNYYGGGIESAGLWTVDWARSAAKRSFAGDRKPPFLVSSIGVPYAQSIYNLRDYEEPEWNLFAKKIFMAGGLKPQATSDYLTIVWSLKF